MLSFEVSNHSYSCCAKRTRSPIISQQPALRYGALNNLNEAANYSCARCSCFLLKRNHHERNLHLELVVVASRAEKNMTNNLIDGVQKRSISMWNIVGAGRYLG